MSYTQQGFFDRSLTDEEELEFRKYAKENDPPNLEMWDFYHPICREEWVKKGIHP